MRRLMALAALAISVTATGAFADIQVLNINFNGDTAGNAPATNLSTAWSPGSPITVPYSLGGYLEAPNDQGDSPPLAAEGSIVVSNPPASQNTTWTTNPTNTAQGALYMDTEYGVTHTSKATLSFDLDVIQASTEAEQDATLTTDSTTAHQFFGVNTFGNEDGLRFTAVSTSDGPGGGGYYGIRTSSDLNNPGPPYVIIPFFDYVNGDTHTISMTADYLTGKLTVSVDGTPELSDYQFTAVTTADPYIDESFFFLNGNSSNDGGSNIIGLDNISLSVPEPGSLALLGLGVGALMGRRKKA